MTFQERFHLSDTMPAAMLDVPLPAGYSPVPVFEFHGRDALQLSEQVGDSGLKKGVLLEDIPATIEIQFDRELSNARCLIFADGDITGQMLKQAENIVRSMLGLRIHPEDFNAFAAADPVFSPLVTLRPGLRIVQAASVFEALTWAIMGQQISVSFAVSLRRTFIQQAGRQHSSGLWCYPSPQEAARLDIEQLTTRQFSRTKADTLLRLAHLISNSEIDLVPAEANSIHQISAALLGVKGIGPWTVNYALLRGYAYADCSLHGDVAVRAAIHKLTGMEARPSIAAAEAFLRPYSPHRTMAAAHLWASLG